MKDHETPVPTAKTEESTEAATHQHRRSFMMTAAKWSALMAGVGLGAELLTADEAEACTPKVHAARNVMKLAISTGDMPGAIKRHGKGLNSETKQALRKVSVADLRNFKEIKKKMKKKIGGRLNCHQVLTEWE